ncbi:MAG: SDR family NAD(P)-dependent oxidoreductase [Sedimentisphaerales bacterium]|nr:SDR family NAD(P)-dependent oxidoreductase [Sedimentisphaerales bacterium]
MPEKLLIIGATSVLAHETAKLFAERKAAFALVARNKEKLEVVAADLKQRGAEQALQFSLDVTDTDSYSSVLNKALESLGGLDIALLAHGSVYDQYACEHNGELLRREIQINFTGTVSLLMLIADVLEKQGSGVIAVISSVAGDRGRRVQYVYGACKAGLTVFLQGLRQRLHRANVSVVTIKAGLADTPFVARLKESRMMRLAVSREVMAKAIYRAIRKRKNQVYAPWFWRYIMMGMKMIPESVFKKMRF